MCGIVASMTKDNTTTKKCIDILFDGLNQIQNRGYDSAGICSIDSNNNFILNKFN